MTNVKRCAVVFLLAVFSSGAMAERMDVAGFVDCLRESGAKYYGTHWCPYCRKQNAMFGENARYLPYVECSPKGSRDQLEHCSHISGYPTWIFADGRKAGGVLGVDTLSNYTGCEMKPKDYFVN